MGRKIKHSSERARECWINKCRGKRRNRRRRERRRDREKRMARLKALRLRLCLASKGNSDSIKNSRDMSYI